MIGERHPALDRGSLILDVRQLERREDTDYLYLVRREKSCLFPIYEVYLPDSYAYLCWTAYTMTSSVPVDAFYLHVSNPARLSGTVVLLDYGESVEDVERAVSYGLKKRAAHLSRKMQEWLEQGRDSPLLELIQSMKGGEPVWTQAEKLPT